DSEAAADGVESPGAAEGADEAAESTGLRTVTYKYDDGLMDYVHHLNSAKRVDLIHPDVISFESEDAERKIAVEIALQWTSAYSESVHTFANTISTTEGG